MIMVISLPLVALLIVFGMLAAGPAQAAPAGATQNTILSIELAYHENFNSGDPWFEFNFNGCSTNNTNSQYWVDLDNNKTCLPPAQNEDKPESPYRTYGEFEVEAVSSSPGE